MRLWVDTGAVNSAGAQVRAKVSEMTDKVDRQVVSRATRAVNELRNAELEVLNGQRGGRKYVSPFASRYDKNGNRRKKLTMYTASAPGEPPARRTGSLRLHWNGTVEASGNTVSAALESQEYYAGYLENGTRKMAARPFHDRIVEKAKPNILRIYGQSYL